MSKSTEKLAALALRRQGVSIKDIAKKLKVSRGSASLWCQEIILTKKQQLILKEKQTAAGARGRQMGADMNRAKRSTALDVAKHKAEAEFTSVSKRELFLLGLGIYWGEGIKSRTSQAAVVNSDPKILQVMIRWFCDCLSVRKSDFRPYVYISDLHRDREEIIMKYWVDTLKLEKEQFKSPIYLNQKPKQKYENHDNYFGVVALRVSKSTNLKYQILAMLQVLGVRLE